MNNHVSASIIEPGRTYGHDMQPESDGQDAPRARGSKVRARSDDPDVMDMRYPARRILDLIGDKWLPIVLYCLSLRDVGRFNELQRQIPDISKKMLIQTLRNLERDGLVSRTVYQQVPPKTEYRLTEDGRKLHAPIAQLCRWAMENQDFMNAILTRRGQP